jgi:hypothetical protein
MQRLGEWLFGLVTVYFIIGAVHSAFFWLTVSRKDCLTATGLVAGYCSVGMGWSHAVVVFGWPYYWIAKTDDDQRLTGNERSEFISGVSDVCVRSKDKNPNVAVMPDKVVEYYCRCYAEGLADQASKKQLREGSDSVMNPLIRTIAQRCVARMPEFGKGSN